MRRRKARTSLIDFTTYTKPDYEADKFHRTLCHYFDLWIDGKIRFLMVFAPPQHGKSEVFSRRGPAYLLGRKPNARLVASSHTSNLASKNNRAVQRIIEDAAYRRLFPQTQLSNSYNRSRSDMAFLKNSDEFEIVDHTGSYRSVGVGQAIAGTPADYVIIDDPVSGSEAANSATARESLWEWYSEEIKTRLSQDGSLLLMHQRWHRDDLAGRILRNATKDGQQWVVLNFPAIAEGQTPEYDGRRDGEALAPSRYSAQALATIKADTPRNSWEALYQQNPRPEGGTEWPAEYFKAEHWFDNWPANRACKILSLDASKGKKETKLGDYSAWIKLVIDTDGICWVEAELDRVNIKLIADRTVELQRDWKADSVPIEALQFQELLQPECERVGRERGVTMPVHPVEDMRPKLIRIRRIGNFLARGELRFRNTPGTRLLVEQLMDFPHAEHDDGPDALDMALQRAKQLLGVEQPSDEYVY